MVARGAKFAAHAARSWRLAVGSWHWGVRGRAAASCQPPTANRERRSRELPYLLAGSNVSTSVVDRGTFGVSERSKLAGIIKAAGSAAVSRIAVTHISRVIVRVGESLICDLRGASDAAVFVVTVCRIGN